MQKLLRLFGWTLVVVVVVGGILRMTLFVPWTIPQDGLLDASLRPTLGMGDTVLVLTRGAPSLGDLVRCPDPEDASRYVVGRIAGMGGDTVEVTGAALRLNGRRYDAVEACAEPHLLVAHPDTGHETKLNCSRVEMGGGWHFRATLAKYAKRNDDNHVVGAGRVYLLSDNRDMHDDSRDFGTLPEESCRQRLVFRLWGPGGWSDSSRRMTVVR